MKTYGVTLPIMGTAYVEVEAGSEEEAIEAALNGEITFGDFSEWDAVRQIVRGRVFCGSTNEAYAEEIEDTEASNGPL